MKAIDKVKDQRKGYNDNEKCKHNLTGGFVTNDSVDSKIKHT